MQRVDRYRMIRTVQTVETTVEEHQTIWIFYQSADDADGERVERRDPIWFRRDIEDQE